MAFQCIHLLKDIWVISNLGLLWKELKWQLMDKSPWRQKFSFFLDKHQGVEPPGYIVSIWCEELPNCFPQWPDHFIPPPATNEGPSTLHSHHTDIVNIFQDVNYCFIVISFWNMKLLFNVFFVCILPYCQLSDFTLPTCNILSSLFKFATYNIIGLPFHEN